MKITAQMLTDKNACTCQVDIFRAEWPNGCTASLRMAKRAADLKLDLDFFARYFLSAPAEKAYEDATAPAFKAYQDATAPALKAYQDAKATALWAAWKKDHTRATAQGAK